MSSLPGPLRVPSSFAFLGRDRELAMLRTLLPSTNDDGGRVAVLSGEPGSGKSRLIRELAHEAAADGALVLYGACDPAVPTPYGPFVTVLEQLERTISPDRLRTDLGTGGGELTRLLPDLPLRVGDLPPPAPGQPSAERHRLHTAVVDLLASVSHRRPTLLVIEDGHWADIPTLLLLCHVSRFAGDCQMLLVATFVEPPSASNPELSASLMELQRVEGTVQLQLEGLNPGEVAEFVRTAADRDLDPDLQELAANISELTGGNPFLMTELWRTLAESEVAKDATSMVGALNDIESPQNVRAMVRRRVSGLASITTGVLETAAVTGPQFTLDVVRRASALDERELLRALDEATEATIIEELPGAALTYRFTHELFRRALYDELSSLRRAELHLRVGTALEEAPGRSPSKTLADVAHHLGAAGALGDPERAVDYNLKAALSARASLAFEQAATNLRTALSLGIADSVERARAQVELGDVCNMAGIASDAIEAYTAAADIARDLGDAELLATSAIGLEEACWRPGIAHAGMIDLLEEASAALGEGDSSLRVGLLSALARPLTYRGEHARAAVVRESATAMARRLGDRRELAELLSRSYWARGSTSLVEILDLLGEGRDLADELGDVELQYSARAWRVITCMSLGNVDVARRELDDMLAIAERARQPFLLSAAEHVASAIALMEGNLEEAEAHAVRSRHWESVLQGHDSSAIHGIQMFSIRREQGRLAELAPVVGVLATGDPNSGSWRPGLIALLVELGMHDEARRELARIQSHGLDLFRESVWMASLTYLADASTALGDEQIAALLRPELEPHAGTAITIAHGVACYGAADRYLGMVAATMRDWDDSAQYFESALELNRRMGARTWLAHTAYEYGRMLRSRSRGEDADRAESLLEEAATLAQAVGMRALLTRIDALRAPTNIGSGLPDGLSPREADILRLVSRGLSNRQIGEQLVISEHTAANHVRSILRKTSSANRTEAAAYAHRHGLAGALDRG